jgi:hypothetical protein
MQARCTGPRDMHIPKIFSPRARAQPRPTKSSFFSSSYLYCGGGEYTGGGNLRADGSETSLDIYTGGGVAGALPTENVGGRIALLTALVGASIGTGGAQYSSLPSTTRSSGKGNSSPRNARGVSRLDHLRLPDDVWVVSADDAWLVSCILVTTC